jgi:hypothetical protein
MTGAVTGQKAAALTATLGLAAACWVLSVERMEGMNVGVATTLGSFGFFVALWAPMMLPGAVPAVVRHLETDRPVPGVPLFLASYLAVWTLFGVVVYALYRPQGMIAAGVVVIAAGAIRAHTAQAALPAALPRGRSRRTAVRGRMPGLEHRADGDARRLRRHEHRLDVGDRHRRRRPEAVAR